MASAAADWTRLHCKRGISTWFKMNSQSRAIFYIKVILIWTFLICSVKIEALLISDGHLGSAHVTEGCCGGRHLGLERVFMAQIQKRSKGVLQAKAGRVYL